MQELDLVVLGTGPAASQVATDLAEAGRSVGIVDPRPFGGTCALHGCNPKKVLVRAAELVDWARRTEGRGVRFDRADIAWSELIRFKRTFTEPVTPAKSVRFERAGVRCFHGRPYFSGPDTLVVSQEPEDVSIRVANVFVATGAVPATLPIKGAEHLITSDAFLDLDELPQRIVFVGGGYISFEFAHVAARAGRSVTILEMADRLLNSFDNEIVERLVERSRTIGIDIRTGVKVESVQPGPDGGFHIAVDDGGRVSEILADLVVHGAGRVPNVAGLGLEAGNVEADEQGIKVNDFLQSISNPRVYAAGDVAATGMPPLTPVANEEGRTVRINLLEGNRATPDYGAVPTAVFTVPTLAAVGKTEQEARQKNLVFKTEMEDWAEFGSLRKVGETHAAYKILVEEGTDRIIGAHLLGPQAAELINVFAMAIKFDLRARDLKSVLFTFPTLTADIRSMLS